MKSTRLLLNFLLVAGVLIAIESCERVKGCTDPVATNYNSDASVDNGTCQYAATFYFDENGPNATVTVNNQNAMITSNYQTGAPTCGMNAAGCANFSLLPGNYNYTATSSLSQWASTFQVSTGCASVILQQSTGSVTFYATANYDTITVTIGSNGATGNITNHFTSGSPLCGAPGCATFDLSPGTYSFTASAPGFTWGPAIVNVGRDSCTLQPLN